MNENILALLQKIADSEELQARFGQFETLDEAYETASTLQQGFTKEEFLDAMKALNEAAEEDVSDEELAAAAGGMDQVIPDNKKTLSCVTRSVSKSVITNTNKPTSIRPTSIRTTEKF